MARAVGLIGPGKGPLVHIGQACRAQIKGLVDGCVQLRAVVGGQETSIQIDNDQVLELGHADYLSFEHLGTSPHLVCNVLF